MKNLKLLWKQLLHFIKITQQDPYSNLSPYLSLEICPLPFLLVTFSFHPFHWRVYKGYSSLCYGFFLLIGPIGLEIGYEYQWGWDPEDDQLCNPNKPTED